MNKVWKVLFSPTQHQMSSVLHHPLSIFCPLKSYLLFFPKYHHHFLQRTFHATILQKKLPNTAAHFLETAQNKIPMCMDIIPLNSFVNYRYMFISWRWNIFVFFQSIDLPFRTPNICNMGLVEVQNMLAVVIHWIWKRSPTRSALLLRRDWLIHCLHHQVKPDDVPTKLVVVDENFQSWCRYKSSLVWFLSLNWTEHEHQEEKAFIPAVHCGVLFLLSSVNWDYYFLCCLFDFLFLLHLLPIQWEFLFWECTSKVAQYAISYVLFYNTHLLLL